MPRFQVYGIFTASKLIGEFDVATEEEAIRLASESPKNHASLCTQCTDQVELDEFCAHEFRVEPADD